MKVCIQGRSDPAQHSPLLEFSLCDGLYGLENSKKFLGIVDTGFTGFIQIPKAKAREAGIVAGVESATNTYADGRQKIVPLAEATVILEGENYHGYVQIDDAPHGPILLGMDFLRRAKRALLVSSNGVYLIAEDHVASMLR